MSAERVLKKKLAANCSMQMIFSFGVQSTQTGMLAESSSSASGLSKKRANSAADPPKKRTKRNHQAEPADESTEVDLHIQEQDPWMDEIVSPIFPDGRPNGSVFIGTSSEELTGTTFHVHSAFIPTIERVKLDFEDKVLGHWNRELLSVAGSLARCVYNHEIQSKAAKLMDTAPVPRSWIHAFTSSAGGSNKGAAAAAHSRPFPEPVMFNETPSERWLLSLVGVANKLPSTRATRVNENLVEKGFFRNLKESILLPVCIPALFAMDSESRPAQDQPATQQRFGLAWSDLAVVPAHGVEAFIALPYLPRLVAERFPELCSFLLNKGFVQKMDLNGAKALLKTQGPLQGHQMISFLQWWCLNCCDRNIFKGGKAEAKDLLQYVSFVHENGSVSACCHL